MSTSSPTTPDHDVVCSGLGLTWPDGGTALAGLDIAFTAGRTGLIGGNGQGKSTLLRVIAGELVPTAGTVTTAGEVTYLPQRLGLQTARTVADLLGVSRRRTALRAIEAGDPDPVHFTVLDDDWDVEARALAALARFGVLLGETNVLDRQVGTLSGGEAVLTGVAGLLLSGAPISLLDEPSNNLDRRARQSLYDAIDTWPGVLLVASHDRELLEHVDSIVELRGGAARTFGGPWSFYLDAVEAEQQAAERHVRAAEGEVAREKRQLIETQVKLARRKRFGAKAFREKREPRIKMNEMKRTAQVSAAKYRDIQAGRLGDAQNALDRAEGLVRDDERIRVDLPDTEVPAGRDVVRVGDLTIRGPERIALTGDNGAGKTTLLEALLGHRRHLRHEVEAPLVPTRYLPQRLVLDESRTVLDDIRGVAPDVTPHEIRAQLARFLVRGDRVGQVIGTLSGGERFRVALARLLLARPAPQLLLLDEPTNSLDVAGVEQLVSALQGYRGALLVVSHDEHFLAGIGVTRRWEVRDMGLPVESAPA